MWTFPSRYKDTEFVHLCSHCSSNSLKKNQTPHIKSWAICSVYVQRLWLGFVARMLWASELSKKTVKGSGFCLFYFFASGTDILPSLIKTLPVTHLIGWLARRLKPCRIKFIYLPQKTHLGRLASERNPARAEAWMTVCGIIFYFSFFF